MRSKNFSIADELTGRIREVRTTTFGQRGRAKFARALGVSPSTYNYYERGRIPPMGVLLKISEVTGVDLRWLLTGRHPVGERSAPVSAEHASILTRMSALLPRRAEAAAALNALLDLLESQPERTPRAAPGRTSVAGATAPSSTCVPVLGRTAAGVPQFWKQPQGSVDLLQSGIAHAGTTGASRVATLSDATEAAPVESDCHVHVVRLTHPVRIGELHVAEFVDSPGLRARYPEAFALRIDGDSMHPSLSHGDLVILSPREAARPGRTAVVQLRDQIGVTCKLFYTDKTHVRLIPINEQFRPTRHPLKDLIWALAVLFRVRLSP